MTIFRKILLSTLVASSVVSAKATDFLDAQE